MALSLEIERLGGPLTMEVLYQLSYVGAKPRSYRSRRRLPVAGCPGGGVLGGSLLTPKAS